MLPWMILMKSNGLDALSGSFCLKNIMVSSATLEKLYKNCTLGIVRVTAVIMLTLMFIELL